MKIGILTAMESEHNQIAALLTDKNTVNDQFTYVVGKLDDKEIILRQCGIGKVNAAVGTAELIRTFHPDYVISTGVAGGIDSCLNVMDVVQMESLTQMETPVVLYVIVGLFGKKDLQESL